MGLLVLIVAFREIDHTHTFTDPRIVDLAMLFLTLPYLTKTRRTMLLNWMQEAEEEEFYHSDEQHNWNYASVRGQPIRARHSPIVPYLQTDFTYLDLPLVNFGLGLFYLPVDPVVRPEEKRRHYSMFCFHSHHPIP